VVSPIISVRGGSTPIVVDQVQQHVWMRLGQPFVAQRDAWNIDAILVGLKGAIEPRRALPVATASGSRRAESLQRRYASPKTRTL
jgi:hypothetical protein